jgi:hypothetical protein
VSNINLRPGEKFRLGRTSYEVLATADIDATLVESDGDKDGIRQVLFVCPKGCVCAGTGKVWKLRTSRKAASGDKFFTCPECGDRMDEGKPNADKKPKAQPEGDDQGQGDPNPADQQGADQQDGGKPQAKPDATQQDIDDLKDALQKVKDDAKGKPSKPKKAKAPKKSKPKAADQGDNPDANETVEGFSKEDLDAMLEEALKDWPEVPEAPKTFTEASLQQSKPQPDALRRCFNCETPTPNEPGKGNITLCAVCEDMREHILDCLK